MRFVVKPMIPDYKVYDTIRDETLCVVNSRANATAIVNILAIDYTHNIVSEETRDMISTEAERCMKGGAE